jgi:hypothetical protein
VNGFAKPKHWRAFQGKTGPQGAPNMDFLE